MKMTKLSRIHRVLWTSLLLFWASQNGCLCVETEDSDQEGCQDESSLRSSVLGHLVESAALGRSENFLCVLYPTDILNCSWSFTSIHREAQVSVHISICDGEVAIDSLEDSSGSTFGSKSLQLREYEDLEVIIRFNVTLHDKWTVYPFTYYTGELEVLSRPKNLNATITGKDLLVVWDQPQSRSGSGAHCFQYQLDMGDQEQARILRDEPSYRKQNVDLSRPYSVRVRAKKKDACVENGPWSEWSEAVTIEQQQSASRLSIPVIISIALGIPMILLALLLFVRHQRVIQILFPPIPSPPQKYKSFLEKGDAFSFFHPAPPAEPDEEITEVVYTESQPEKGDNPSQ